MSDKTITQLAIEAGVETGGTENALAILKFAKAYADQEKRKEAIAFAEWIIQEDWYPNNAKEWIKRGDLAEYITIQELYDRYLQSLPKTV